MRLLDWHISVALRLTEGSPTSHLLEVEVAGVTLAVQLRDKGCLGPGQIVPVQARKPGVLLELAGAAMTQADVGVDLQQRICEVSALC